SSRRRHTRFSRDWSSDVCSSDLLWAFKPMRMGLIGILLVPLVYCVIYLSAFYDPYENLQYLPVALVNEDRGAVQDGEKIHVGDEIGRASCRERAESEVDGRSLNK